MSGSADVEDDVSAVVAESARDRVFRWDGGAWTGCLAGDDVPAAERYLADIDVLDQLLQVIPWPAESGEVPYEGACSILTCRFRAIIVDGAHCRRRRRPTRRDGGCS